MSYSDNFPSQRASLLMDFSNGGRIDPRATFSRASTGSYFGTEKVLSSENLLLQSQGFDTTWSASGIGSPTGSQSAPDGTSTAWLITANTGSVGPRVQQTVSLTTGSSYTLVAHVKAGTATHAYVCLRGDSSNDYAYAILEFASPSSVTTGGVGFTGISGSVTALGSSWYRISVTSTAASVSSPIAFVGITDGTAPSSNGVATYTAAGETLYIWGAQLNTTGATVYDSPTTTQIARSYQTKLQTAASGAARFEHSATDGQSVAKGLLLESARTNLLTYSNDFSQWGATNVVAEAGAAVGPDGQLAYVMREDSTAGVQHRLALSANNQSYSAAHTMSVYAKKVASSNQTRYLRLRVNGLSGEASVQFDLSNGTVVRTSGSQLDGQSISSVGNGWYRITMTYSNTASERAVGMIITGSPDTTDTLPSYDGDGFSAFALFGAMVEEGSHASSLITSNSGSQTTRALDSLSLVSSSLFNSGEHTLYYEGDVLSSRLDDPALLYLSDGTGNERIRLDNNNGVFLRLETASGSVSSASIQDTIDLTVGSHKIVGTLKNGEARLVRNGATVIESTTGTEVVPTGLTTLDIGESYAAANHLDGHVRRISYWNTALTETQAQAISS